MKTTEPRMGWASIVALALVPLLAVAALIGLAGNRADSTASAAVVNLDEAVTVNGQYVPMGRQLAAAMVDRDGENIDWTLADAPSAAAGLKTGEYSAVVTIPKGFSAAATSFSANDAAKAEQATIQVQVSENAPVTDSQVAQEISRLAVDTINSTLTGSYLDGIYVGFNTVGEQFSTIVDGAKQLHDGSTELAKGTTEAAQGGAQLRDGMDQLAENGPKLTLGGEQLVSGIGDLKDGTSQLSDGASQLSDGVSQFAAQTPELVSGVGELATGADELLGGIPQFADGAAQAIGGVSPLRQGLDQMITEIGSTPVDTSQFDPLIEGATGLKTGTAGISTGAAGISKGIDQVAGTLGGYSAGGPLDPQTQAALDGVTKQFQDGLGCQPDDPNPMCGMLKQAVEAGFKTGTGVGAGMLTSPDPTTGQSLSGGASDLSDGAAQVADGASELAAGVTSLPDAIAKETAEQMGELTGGLTQMRDGAKTLEEQAAPLVASAPQLSEGAKQLNSGIQQLNDEIGALPDGVNQLSTGAKQLADGASELDTGVGTLKDGATTFVDGVSQYADGVESAADGTASLVDGLVQLSAGTTKLDEGIGTFASELAKGADQVPSYSQGDREKLAKVVASPVERSESLMAGGKVPLVSLLLLTGLWLGALAAYVAVRPVPRDAVASRESSLTLWGRALWLPAAIVGVQGLLLGLVGGIVLGAGVGTTLGLMGLLALLGLSFVLANHALAGWWGNIGRAISALLLVVTIGLGVSSAVGWLGPIGVVSPLHNGFTLVRTWLSGGTGEIGIAAVSVLMFAIAATLSYLAIATKRRITADRFRKSITTAA